MKNLARLGSHCDDRDNNLNLIRITAATGVLVSHAWPISQGAQAVQPLERLLGVPLGQVMVMVFFAIAGFLITRSFERSRDLADWASGRVLRLFPGLIVATLLSAFVLGPLVTALPLADYLMDPRTLAYMPRNVTLVSLQYPLPGVFAGQPAGAAVNGSLWTLFHEVLCYLGVLLLGLLGVLRRAGAERGMIAAVVLYGLAHVAGGLLEESGQLPYRLARFRELSLPYVLGVCAWVWRDRVVLSWWIAAALWLPTLLLKGAPGAGPLLPLAIAYATACAAYLPRGGFIRGYNRIGDYSYGVYIYAFPLQQLAVHLFGPATPGENIALALPVTVLKAVLSWHLVERPVLTQRHRLANCLRVRRSPAA